MTRQRAKGFLVDLLARVPSQSAQTTLARFVRFLWRGFAEA